MFNSLSQFYTSQEWRNFRQIVIAQRTKSDGFVYDEFNGQPLVRAFDIIAHHKIPLTMQNVNDYTISLNPENIMLVSMKSHNEIHARFGNMMEKKVYFVWGAPCSGKTTYVNENKGNSDLVVDIDNIWQCVTGGARYEKPNALKTNVFAIRDLLLDQVRTRTGKWEKAFVIASESHQSSRKRMIDLLGAEEIFVDVPKEECIKRLHENPEGRDFSQWKGFIEKFFEENEA